MEQDTSWARHHLSPSVNISKKKTLSPHFFSTCHKKTCLVRKVGTYCSQNPMYLQSPWPLSHQTEPNTDRTRSSPASKASNCKYLHIQSICQVRQICWTNARSSFQFEISSFNEIRTGWRRFTSGGGRTRGGSWRQKDLTTLLTGWGTEPF